MYPHEFMHLHEALAGRHSGRGGWQARAFAFGPGGGWRHGGAGFAEHGEHEGHPGRRGPGRGGPGGFAEKFGGKFGGGFGGRGFGGPGFGGPRFGRGPQVGRGGIRAALLALLAEQPMHGYQMIRELSERSGNAWRPSPGSVYPTLQLLEDEGLVRAEEANGRRIFHLTDAGRAHTEAHAAEAKPWEEASDAAGSGISELRSLAMQVAAAVMQVAHAGSSAQVGQAREVLANTRRSLYRILADDDAAATHPSDEGSGVSLD